MKHKILFLLLLASCTKDTKIEPYPTREVMAFINGQKWEAESWFIDDPNASEAFQINMVGYDEDGVPREHLSFIGVPNKLGQYSIFREQNPRSTFNLSTADGDVPLAFYNTLSDQENYIVIEDISPDSKVIRGSFQTSYSLVMQYDSTVVLDENIVITSGVFESIRRRN